MNFLKNIITKIKIKRFYNFTLKDVDSSNLTKKSKFIIVSIAFNNYKLLQFQIELIKKNVLDDCLFVVADNSSNLEVRKKIEEICFNTSVGYISLPPNPYVRSASHAAALNWVYEKFITIVEPIYFGFIDHDAFPIKPHLVSNVLNKQVVFGHLQTRESYWYLWAGLCFFNYSYTKGKKIDFFPCNINGVSLDTGGGNYSSLYHHLVKEDIYFPKLEYHTIRDGGNSVQSDKVEILDDWMHTFNGSYWMEMKAKENDIEMILKQYY